MRVTPAQLRALRLTEKDGTLILGGIDGRAVRRDVVLRLHSMGLLAWRASEAGYEHSEWTLTEAGKRVCDEDGIYNLAGLDKKGRP